MRLRPLFLTAFVLCIATGAVAQQRPIFDVDDFLDPRQHEGQAVFTSRLILGAVANFVDDYRPLAEGARFVHVTNSFYRGHFEFSYKHSEVFGDHASPPVQVCNCVPPLYFPTFPPADSTPAPPSPGRKDMLQVGFYRSVAGPPAEPPIMLRYRLSWGRQPIHTVVTDISTEQIAERRYGREQSLGLEADTYFRVLGHDVFGSVAIGRTARSGTIDNRAQNELTYTNRFPAVSAGPILLRAMLTVGGVSGRGATGLNVVNPWFEAFWHHRASQANVHLVWSPQSTRSGARGWETHHQVALFVDRALFVKLIR